MITAPILYMFLDDIRNPPGTHWMLFRDPYSFLKEILNFPPNVVMSLDHDLGEDFISGYQVLCEIERLILSDKWTPDSIEIKIHSQNPVGYNNMMGAIGSIYVYLAAKER